MAAARGLPHGHGAGSLPGFHRPAAAWSRGGIALSALLLEAMVGGEVRPTLVVAALLVGVFAVCHGRAHGTELPAGQRGLLYSMGFVSATGCLHGLGIALGLLHRWPAGTLALRGAGALIAVMDVWCLWRAMI